MAFKTSEKGMGDSRRKPFTYKNTRSSPLQAEDRALHSSYATKCSDGLFHGDRASRAFRLASGAGNTFVGADDRDLALTTLDAFYGTHIHAFLALGAFVSINNGSHLISPS
jgi:hypothetical protein